jgi:murein DD-endopeptidase MepM/ murein hydrolase activator NlpD
MRAFTADDAVGGALDWRTTGLDAKRVGTLAAQIGKNAADQTVAALNAAQFMPGLGAALGPGGFPLPRGRYRVGRGSAAHGYPAVDFPAVTGTPVYAVRSGVVSRALRLATSYGIHAILAHAGGWGSLYAHMSQMFVRAGQSVRAGQQIGRVGSTGNSTGPHLHFEARHPLGVRVNPRSLISYDQGGWLPRGVSLAYNGTGGPERVVGPNDPMQVNIQLPDLYARVPTLMPALQQVARIEVDEAFRLREMAARRGGRA